VPHSVAWVAAHAISTSDGQRVDVHSLREQPLGLSLEFDVTATRACRSQCTVRRQPRTHFQSSTQGLGHPTPLSPARPQSWAFWILSPTSRSFARSRSLALIMPAHPTATDCLHQRAFMVNTVAIKESSLALTFQLPAENASTPRISTWRRKLPDTDLICEAWTMVCAVYNS
jgi:hypothetical protein